MAFQDKRFSTPMLQDENRVSSYKINLENELEEDHILSSRFLEEIDEMIPKSSIEEDEELNQPISNVNKAMENVFNILGRQEGEKVIRKIFGFSDPTSTRIASSENVEKVAKRQTIDKLEINQTILTREDIEASADAILNEVPTGFDLGGELPLE